MLDAALGGDWPTCEACRVGAARAEAPFEGVGAVGLRGRCARGPRFVRIRLRLGPRDGDAAEPFRQPPVLVCLARGQPCLRGLAQRCEVGGAFMVAACVEAGGPLVGGGCATAGFVPCVEDATPSVTRLLAAAYRVGDLDLRDLFFFSFSIFVMDVANSSILVADVQGLRSVDVRGEPREAESMVEVSSVVALRARSGSVPS